MLSESEKSQLRDLIQSGRWNLITMLAEDFCKRLRDNPTIGTSEWELVRETLRREGQIEGVKAFLQELFNSLQ